MTLDELPLHVQRVIASVQADRAVAQRLMAMGFLPGAPVEVVQVAPFGDPITVELSGWRVSLRHSEARLIRTRAPGDAMADSSLAGDSAWTMAGTALPHRAV